MCPDCGGCTDDRCTGGCGERWCGGTYMAEGCDRCPEKVYKKSVETHSHGMKEIYVRCNGSEGHYGAHHWDPWKVGR